MQPETDKQPAPTIRYRKGRPAWNVKRYTAPTAEECAQVFAEYGERPADALARPGTRTGDALPWGPAWIEATAERNPAAYSEEIGRAARYAFEHAEEYARELFGARANVYSDGRSSGWLVLDHPSVTDTEVTAAELLLGYAEDDPSNPILDDVTAEELRDARELLDNLDKFGRYVAASLADHGSAQAFELFHLFGFYAMQYAEEQAEAEAAARLDRARTAFEDAATRLRDELYTRGPDRDTVAAFDAARLELERAKGLARCPDCTPLPDGSSECSDCGELPAPKGGAS